MSGSYLAQGEKNLARIVQSIRDLYAGRSNAFGNFTLVDGATSTVVTAPNCSANSSILIFPTSANAAADIATTYVSSVGQGTFTITHPNRATTDRTFRYATIG